jgi:phosphoglycerol transferase MdoB-like AlkP superfamily enzyme
VGRVPCPPTWNNISLSLSLSLSLPDAWFSLSVLVTPLKWMSFFRKTRLRSNGWALQFTVLTAVFIYLFIYYYYYYYYYFINSPSKKMPQQKNAS